MTSLQSTSVLIDRGDGAVPTRAELTQNLFGRIEWSRIQSRGVFLTAPEHQLLERAQDNLAMHLDSDETARKLCSIFIKLADNCIDDSNVQQYVYLCIEEILGINASPNDAENGAFGPHRAALFTTDGTTLNDGPFLKTIQRSSDAEVKKSASLGLACLLTQKQGNLEEFMTWLCLNLDSSKEGGIEDVLPTLCMILRSEEARKAFIAKNGVFKIVQSILKIGNNGNAQQLYDFSFCLWTLSLGADIPLPVFLSNGAVASLIGLLVAAPSRKVVRMSVAALRNLANSEDVGVLTEMLANNLHKVLENVIFSNAHKQANDQEVEQDFRTLYDILMKNFRDLSTFERWASEVQSGALRWGVVHTDRFWKENAKFLEKNDFEHLRALIALLDSPDKLVVSIALYDIGEFTRFFPNGRAVTKQLGAKDRVMQMINNDDQDIQRQALQCISKIMVTNWEFMR